jgi:hypothetical protein
MTKTAKSTTQALAADLRRGDTIVYEGRRVILRDVQDYGDHFVLKGIETADRHMFTLHVYRLNDPFTKEA